MGGRVKCISVALVCENQMRATPPGMLVERMWRGWEGAGAPAGMTRMNSPAATHECWGSTKGQTSLTAYPARCSTA